MTGEESLADLVNNLKRLSGQRTPATGAAPAARVEPGQVVDNLMEALLEYAGFRASDRLRRKLEFVFRKAPEEELRRWRRMLDTGAGEDHLTALVEDLTNHETYFFRDEPQLNALSHNILPELIQRQAARGKRSLKIWCAAVSTGEEAYTLAILAREALLEHAGKGAGEWDISVLGTDISRQAIRVARDAVYQSSGMASFRNLPARYDRYFETVNTGNLTGHANFRQPVESIRKWVRFERFNLKSNAPATRNADLVLCRNVLIYLDTALHGPIQSMLGSALRPGGYLMLSPVDRLHAKNLFHPRWIDRNVVYEKRQ